MPITPFLPRHDSIPLNGSNVLAVSRKKPISLYLLRRMDSDPSLSPTERMKDGQSREMDSNPLDVFCSKTEKADAVFFSPVIDREEQCSSVWEYPYSLSPHRYGSICAFLCPIPVEIFLK
ncbi:Hypothetical protein NTJ_00310 [Nesidiocoris tenuis]|uniref:Uncharacterized protein n=1 Tax=Nesidiocoris tenuis TaxID=355587 RepID=A0ABN7A5U3_9HEMI|nr:Hypothetical protein NTJ_00310 [Nesidiocoris tenuis]